MSADPVRDEAERLVSAAIAAVSFAAQGLGGGPDRFATGSAECCICPICRVVAAMRDPDPELTERLAAGAGDLATAVAGLLRTLNRPTEQERAATADGDHFWETMRQRARSGTSGEDPWHAATTTPEPKPMAKKATKKAAAAKPATAPAGTSAGAAPRKVAKKAVKAAKSRVVQSPQASLEDARPASAMDEATE